MNPSINSTDLETAIKTVIKALSLTRSANTVGISYKDNAVTVKGSVGFFDSTISFTLNTKSNGAEGDWEIYVNLRQLKEAAECFPKNIALSVFCETEGDREYLVLASVSGKSRVVTCKPEFAVSSTGNPASEPEVWVIPPSSLSDLVKNSAFAASTDVCKQALTGVSLTFSERGVEGTSTDGHRLTEFSLEGESYSKEGSVVIMAKPLRELSSLASKKGSDVEVKNYPGERCLLSFDYKGNKVVYSQKETPTYPNTKQLFPDRFKESFSVDQKELLKELEQVAKVVKQGNNTVILDTTSNGTVRAIAHSGDSSGATYEGRVECHGSTDGIRIGFNVRYLIEFLKLPVAKCRTIKFSCNTPTTPAVLTIEGCDNYRYLVMPVQIRS